MRYIDRWYNSICLNICTRKREAGSQTLIHEGVNLGYTSTTYVAQETGIFYSYLKPKAFLALVSRDVLTQSS